MVRPDIKLGICGEHGGDAASIRFCHAVGLDYVSCSPYRVPIARLAAAQAALDEPAALAPARAKGKVRPGAVAKDRHLRVRIAAGRRPAAKRISVGQTMRALAAARPKPPMKKAAAKAKRPSKPAPKGKWGGSKTPRGKSPKGRKK
jgi:pyruvate,orthophosphate dikinase